VGQPVARFIRQELIALHAGQRFTHDRGLFLSSSDEAWSYALGFLPTLPSQKDFNLLCDCTLPVTGGAFAKGLAIPQLSH
jgi:hypothetical protein